ncbi:cell division protein PerM [Streptomyces sp. NPDC002644]
MLLRFALRLRLRLLLGRTAAGGVTGGAAAEASPRSGARPAFRTTLTTLPLPAVVTGLAAAGAGLAVLAVPLVLLWMTSPYPDSGPGNALHTTAAVWLLAHGVELVRTETLTGVPAPMGVAPLLLTVLPVRLLYRAGRAAAEGDGRADVPPPSPLAAWAGVTAGYLVAGLAAAAYATGGEYRPGWGPPVLALPALTAAAALSGVWAGCEHPRRAVDRLPGRLPVLLLGHADRGRRLTATVRAAAEGTAVLVAGGALLALAALVLRAGDAGHAFGRLADGLLGGMTLLLLCLALLPNAAVWAAAYALGPGFVVGPAVVGPLAVSGPVDALPAFPWLAAVPAAAPGPVVWALAAVPVAAGVAIGVRTGRRAAAGAVPWPWLRTVVLAAAACVLCGAALGVLTALSTGPLGTGALAAFGPVWWRSALAATVWVLPAALPAALLTRWTRRRP